ncbi:rab proteins geranylgeranyltransferase component A [Octopus sinensis]|uniref:Rab proteins geranylgeranyltransferase component A n=1 Tax=Octopus sinensis TaxID=2607531 RepID=A0A6P7U637_9MOLL|nr:rab proteins geranylgeranyltransferase component A [Octopus sinensis]
MDDVLPSSFDAIVIGTGLSESIVASALSRIGKTVLHIDRNAYYGSRWASFSLRNLQTWISTLKEKEQLKLQNTSCDMPDSSVDINPHLQEGESFILLSPHDEGFSNIQMSYHHISTNTTDERDASNNTTSNVIKTEQDQSPCDIHEERSEANDGINKVDEDTGEVEETENKKETSENKKETSENKKETSENKEETSENKQLDSNSVMEATTDSAEELKEIEVYITSEKTSENVTNNKVTEKWTVKKFEDQWRRFNFDTAPKVLFCNGDMVHLLIQSDISRYCEFKLVSRILTIFQNELKKVPCSRAHIFNSREVSMLEKRIMMKFVKACLENSPDEAMKEFYDRPFSAYLEEKFSPIARHYIYHGIAMAQKSTTTKEGIALAQKFFSSVGQYGDIPFITSIYGVGELPQAFSRMCAVWGGIYCLNLSVKAIVIHEGKAKAVITSDGKRIECEWLIVEPSYIPDDIIESMETQIVNRAILVTDQTLLQSPKEELSLLNIYPPEDTSRPVVMLEYPPSAMVCPTGLCLIHFTRQGEADPKTELDYACKYLFNFEPIDEDKKDTESAEGDTQQSNDARPNVLWSLFFQVKSKRNVKLQQSLPNNILVTSQPGSEIDLDFYPGEAKHIFETMYPGEEFHPKCPHPEDIIYCSEEDKSTASENDTYKNESDSNTTISESLYPNTTSSSTIVSDSDTLTTIDSLSDMKLDD